MYESSHTLISLSFLPFLYYSKPHTFLVLVTLNLSSKNSFKDHTQILDLSIECICWVEIFFESTKMLF